MTQGSVKHKITHTLTLFSSFSTLICCALPALLVALGAGSVMVSLVASMPWLVFISEHKLAVFIFAGMMLFISIIMQWRNRNMACPLDPTQAEACLRLRKYSAIVLSVSLTAYTTGFFFAYFAKYFLR